MTTPTPPPRASTSLPPTSPRYKLRKPLTMAQARVADLVARGIPYKEIARRLSITEATARVHVNAIAASCLPDDFRADQRGYVRVVLWFQALLISGDTAAD